MDFYCFYREKCFPPILELFFKLYVSMIGPPGEMPREKTKTKGQFEKRGENFEKVKETKSGHYSICHLWVKIMV